HVGDRDARAVVVEVDLELLALLAGQERRLPVDPRRAGAFLEPALERGLARDRSRRREQRVRARPERHEDDRGRHPRSPHAAASPPGAVSEKGRSRPSRRRPRYAAAWRAASSRRANAWTWSSAAATAGTRLSTKEARLASSASPVVSSTT